MPNEVVLAEYRKANMEYRLTTEDYVEDDWIRKTGQDLPIPRPIRKRINTVYRKKVGAKQEYLLYNETQIGTNENGNQDFHFSRTVGAYDLPRFETKYNNEQRKYVPYSISGQQRKYSIPFSNENLQKILTGQSTGAPSERSADAGIEEHDTKFVLDAGYARFGGFTADDFFNRTWDELMTKATTGKYPEAEKKVQEKQREKPAVATTKKVKQVKRGLVSTAAVAAEAEEAATDIEPAVEEYARMDQRADMLDAVPEEETEAAAAATETVEEEEEVGEPAAATEEETDTEPQEQKKSPPKGRKQQPQKGWTRRR